jgi:hypothetical protein
MIEIQNVLSVYRMSVFTTVATKVATTLTENGQKQGIQAGTAV